MNSSNFEPKPVDQKEHVSDDFERLESLFSDQVQPLPHRVLDKQILAAAHREIQVPKKVMNYRTSWWRRLSLPLYVAAGFTLTVFAYKSLWQPPVYLVEPDTGHTASVTFDSEPVVVKSEVQESTLIKREMPEFLVAPDVLERAKNDSIVSDFKQEINDDFTPSIKKEAFYTGSGLAKAIYPEKEAWARKIINHMLNGNIEIARSELISFKKIYPDYPIEEQIKGLSR